MLAPDSPGSIAPPDAATPPAAHRGFPSARQCNWLTLALFCYFALRLMYLAVQVSPVIPPDEVTHLGVSSVFSDTLLLPDNSPASFQYGLVTTIPWLYYWIMGKLLHLNFFPMSDLLFLRLCNIPLSLAMVWYGWRTMRRLTADRLALLLFLVAITNTMMLSFLGAFVSYDNLANLLCAMAIYYLLAFFRERAPGQLAASLACQLAGCLTKITVLPLVLVLGLVLVLHEAKNLPRLPAGLAGWFRESRRGAPVLAALVLAGLALNLQLYGGNYLKYGTLVPQMTQVLPLESALQYRLVARGYIFDQFRDGKLTEEQALQMTGKIEHPGDRADAQFLIKNYAAEKGRPPMGFLEYVPLWIKRMASGVYGIFGHLALPSTWPLIAPFAFLGGLTLVALVLRWRPRDEKWLPADLLVIACAYTFFLMYRINYQEYLDSRAPYLALQGRYLFPVIGPAYAVGSLYLMRLFRDGELRLALFGVASAIFLACDFPLFLARTTPQWFYWPPIY